MNVSCYSIYYQDSVVIGFSVLVLYNITIIQPIDDALFTQRHCNFYVRPAVK